ncbi:MAG TPA: biotin/lipoyl-containing protein, partial [Ktedonobacterales bacterium]|nr:biotin/lipoyl-containing protein [Ktedonobacterales bacterium]
LRSRVSPSPHGKGESDQTPEAISVMIERLAGEGALLTLVGADGSRETLYLARRGYEIVVWRRGWVTTLAKPRPLDVETAAHSGETLAGAQTLRAPMAGTIIKVNAQAGDTVAERQTVVVLGAMKMEHAIVTPHAARVRRVTHAAGDVVPGGEPLVELEPLEE